MGGATRRVYTSAGILWLRGRLCSRSLQRQSCLYMPDVNGTRTAAHVSQILGVVGAVTTHVVWALEPSNLAPVTLASSSLASTTLALPPSSSTPMAPRPTVLPSTGL